jgi:23S rRNA (adenine2503-C2)-methyltransferase
MTPIPVNLLDLSYEDLTQRLAGWGQPRFRANQVWHWLYRSPVCGADEMSNLPKELRARLQTEAYIGCLKTVGQLLAEDGQAEKVLLQTTDEHVLETVLMRYTERNTLCVSSQIGCPVGCPFCATGQQGFVRNLTTGEITAQVLHYARQLRAEGAQVTHVVFMGMGEPLLNLDAVWQAILNLNAQDGFGLGARRFTLSTVGVVPGIERLAHASLPVGLAISLHAADNMLRDRLVPINRRYPVERLLAASKLYAERTGRRVTFEYALIQDVNDSEAHARRLVALLRGMLGHVNLIPLNPTTGCDDRPSSPERVARFAEILKQGHVPVTVRLRRGVDIQAGCGQLRGQYLEESSEEDIEEYANGL